MTSQPRHRRASSKTRRAEHDASATEGHEAWTWAPLTEATGAEGDDLGDSRFRRAAEPKTTGAVQRSRVPRRARASRGPWAWRGVAAVAVGGAIWVALWQSLLSPTGQPGVDAVWRAILVALGAVSGARARRWTLFGVALAASVFAEGVGLIAGLSALAAISTVLAVDRRNWVVGAVAGGGATIAMMSLRPVGPVWMTALLGTTLYLVLAVSAWGRLGREARRRVGMVAAGIVVVAVVGMLAAGIVTLGVRSELERAIDATRRGARRLVKARPATPRCCSARPPGHFPTSPTG